MRVILAIIFIVFATKAITEEPIKAITSDGKEVLLNEQDMTWQYAGDKPNESDNLIYSDDALEIEYMGSDLDWQSRLELIFEIRARKPTTIVKYSTHRFVSTDDGGFRYQTAVSDNLEDNFGNSYAVCGVGISSQSDGFAISERSTDFDRSQGIFYGKPKKLRISLCGSVLDLASFLTGSLNNRVFRPLNSGTDFKIFLQQ